MGEQCEWCKDEPAFCTECATLTLCPDCMFEHSCDCAECRGEEAPDAD